ncbi:GSCFA domain-containing protein [Lacinutrix chionoecetis]
MNNTRHSELVSESNAMKLQTEIKLKQQEHNQIDYNSKLLLLGSCFSENIGAKFSYFKFQNVSNPFGILFHSKAIENLLARAIDKNLYSEKDIFLHNEQWHCFDAHSSLSNTSKDGLLQTLNAQLLLTNKQITQSTHIIITFGTAWVYNLVSNGETVANCHKVAQNQFDKHLLSIDSIKQSIENSIEAIKSVNKEATIVFTVSPVRHIKDGFIENTQSKSHLISAIQSVLSTQEQSKSLNYFPSYEIMLDELRDYRFYKSDMLHPNDTAVTYIWEKFVQVWMAAVTQETMLKVETIQKGLQHKPFNKNSQAHQIFLKKLNQQMEALKKDFPNASFN